MSNPISTITYGTFTFPFTTCSCQSGVLYDVDRMTRIGVHYVFTVSGWIGGADQGTLQTTIASMQSALSVPRKDFKVQWSPEAGSPFFEYNNTFNEPVSDIDWGPKPGELNITKFSGGRAAMYQWTVEVNTLNSTLGSDVLSIVWNFAHSVDPSGFTTRTVSGKLLIDSGSAQNQLNSDHYRAVITNALPVPTWFKRERQDWSQDETGRVLSFTIVDQEYNWTPPIPITRADVSWMVRMGGFDSGLIVTYSLSGFMETSAAHTKNEILAVIFNLAAIKFGSVGSNVTLIPGERMIREAIYKENRVDFAITATSPGGAAPNGVIDYTVGLATFGIAPPNSQGQPILINPYGQTDELSSGLVAPQPPLYDAITAQQASYQFPAQNQPANTVAYGNNPIQAPTGAGFTPITNGLSGDALSTPIVYFHEEISYEIDNMMVYLPPKLAGKDPIIQQTALPSLTVIQAGMIKEIAKTTKNLFGANNPLSSDQRTSSAYTVMQYYPAVTNSEPVGDGSFNMYTTEWRYVMKYNKALSAQSLQGILPFDPRRNLKQSEIMPGSSLPTPTQIPTA